MHTKRYNARHVHIPCPCDIVLHSMQYKISLTLNLSNLKLSSRTSLVSSGKERGGWSCVLPEVGKTIEYRMSYIDQLTRCNSVDGREAIGDKPDRNVTEF